MLDIISNKTLSYQSNLLMQTSNFLCLPFLLILHEAHTSIIEPNTKP